MAWIESGSIDTQYITPLPEKRPSLTEGGDRSIVGRRHVPRNLLTKLVQKSMFSVVGIGVIAAAYPLVAGDVTFENVFLISAIFSMAAISLNFTLGYAGEYALGQAGPFAAAGYVSAVLTTNDGWNFWLSLLTATAAGGLVGLIAGVPGLRLGSWYLALTSLLVAIVIPEIAADLPFAGGTTGLGGVPVPSIFGYRFDLTDTYIFALASLACLLVLMRNLVKSIWGRCFALLKQSDLGVQSVGVSVYRTKLIVYFIGSIVAGYAGAIYPHIDGYVSPDLYPLSLSVLFVGAVVLGGEGVLYGPMIGVTIFEIVPQLSSGFASYSLIVYGGVLIVVAAAIPMGIVPWLRAKLDSYAGTTTMVDAPVLNAGGQDSTDFKATVEREGRLRRVIRFARSRQEVQAQAALNGKPARLIVNDSDKPVSAVSHPLLLGNVLAVKSDPNGENGQAAVALCTVDVRKSFAGNVALDGVSISVESGTISAIVGPNGSGKTTLLNIICGYYKLDKGEVWLGGRRIDGLRPYAIAREGIARTFQVPCIPDDESTEEIVMSGMFSKRRALLVESVVHSRRARDEERRFRSESRRLVEYVGAAPWIRKRGSELPLGTQRIVEIARGLATGAPVLLLDEPAAGLIGEEVDELGTVLRDVRAKGLTVVLVEHNVNFVMEISDTVNVLDQGRLIATGEPEVVRRSPEVIECYLGKRDVKV